MGSTAAIAIVVATETFAAGVFIIDARTGLPPTGGQHYFSFEDFAPSGDTNAYTSITLQSGNVKADIRRTSGGLNYGFDIRDNTLPDQDKPYLWGRRSLSPFGSERNPAPFVLDFSTPVKSVSMSFGDFGADSPDELSLRGYQKDASGNFELVDSDLGFLNTDRQAPFKFNSDTLKVSDSDGISRIEFIGGTASFPNSVYYDGIIATRPTAFRLSTDISKQEELRDLAESYTRDFLFTESSKGVICLQLPGRLCDAAKFASKRLNPISNLVSAGQLMAIVNDPPRFDYDQFADLDFDRTEILSEAVSSSLERKVLVATAAAAERKALMDAWLVTLERYQGADIEGDVRARMLQEELLDRIIVRTAAVSSELADYTNQYMSELLAGTSLAEELSVSRDDLNSLLEDVRTNGLSQDTQDALAELNVGDAVLREIEVLFQDIEFVEGLSVSPGDFSSQDRLTSDFLRCSGQSCLQFSGGLGDVVSTFGLGFQLSDFSSTQEYQLKIADKIFSDYVLDDDGYINFDVELGTIDELSSQNTPFFLFSEGELNDTSLITDVRLGEVTALTPVPLPASGLLLVLGLASLGGWRSRERKKDA